MCNRARNKAEPETLHQRFHVKWWSERPMDNRFNPAELYPRSRAHVVRDRDGKRGLDIMQWDVLGGGASWPMTNVRNLKLPQWRALASDPAQRCLVPLTEFCEWTPAPLEPPGGGKPIKGEMWFAVPDQPIFAVAGFWQDTAKGSSFAMVTCDANELVKPVHPKGMVTIIAEGDWDRWLTGGYDDVVALQRPYPAGHMAVRGPVFPTRQS